MNNMIKQRRKQLGLSQNELADQLGVTVSWLSKLENGKKPTVMMASRLAKVLDCKVSDFF